MSFVAQNGTGGFAAQKLLFGYFGIVRCRTLPVPNENPVQRIGRCRSPSKTANLASDSRDQLETAKRGKVTNELES